MIYLLVSLAALLTHSIMFFAGFLSSAKCVVGSSLVKQIYELESALITADYTLHLQT